MTVGVSGDVMSAVGVDVATVGICGTLFFIAVKAMRRPY